MFSDRWLVDVQWAHVGNDFILDFQSPELNDVQPMFEITTNAWARSYMRSGPFLRPTNSVDVMTNYFLPGVLGGDHGLEAGFRWRTARGYSEAHRGGNTIARFRNGIAAEADLYRDSVTDYHLKTWAIYPQDTYTVRRLTLNLGFRLDSQDDVARASSVPAHPFAPQWLPAVSFGGTDPGVVWRDFSPRLPPGASCPIFRAARPRGSSATSRATTLVTIGTPVRSGGRCFAAAAHDMMWAGNPTG